MVAPIRTGSRHLRQAGFTYLGILYASALLGVLMAISGMLWSTAQQREKERELLFAGNSYREAIKAYYLATPGYEKRFPKRLDDLLLDRRQLSVTRYLRRLYRDPMTQKGEWGLVLARDGGIAGVYSTSDKRPFMQNGFRASEASFAGVSAYSGWRFVVNETTLTATVSR